MSIGDDQLRDLKDAYQAIDVPLDASAHSIKQSYRRLVRRWHPDLFASGTTDPPTEGGRTSMVESTNVWEKRLKE